MSQKGSSSNATKNFLARRRSSRLTKSQQEQRIRSSSVPRVFKKGYTGHSDEQGTRPRTSLPIDIDAQMATIKEQLNGLRLQRTDMQRRVEDINTTLEDIRGDFASHVSLSGSTSELSSVCSLVIFSDESSSLSSGHSASRCCLSEEDCESSGIEFDMEDDDCETEYASSSASSSTMGTAELGLEETYEEEDHPELLSVSQVAYL